MSDYPITEFESLSGRLARAEHELRVLRETLAAMDDFADARTMQAELADTRDCLREARKQLDGAPDTMEYLDWMDWCDRMLRD